MKEYKGSSDRLMRFFEKARDAWRAKAAAKQEIIDSLRGDVRDKTESRDYWKKKAKAAEKELREVKEELAQREGNPSGGVEEFGGLPLAPGIEGTVPSPPKGHAWPVFTILLGVQGAIEALMSFRASQTCFQLFSAIFSMLTPSFGSVRNWMFRIGLHEFQREREHRSDWIFIVDANINLGKLKCLVTLGIPRARLLEIAQQAREGARDGLALRHQDVDVLDMHVSDNLTGEVVERRLEEVALRVGAPAPWSVTVAAR